MSAACQYLHEALSGWPPFRSGFDPDDLPKNGLYFLFEKGEMAHGVNRIVRVGTHRGQDNLAKRIREHLFTPNKDRSIFRKHVGRCLLSRSGDPLIDQWEIGLTTRKARDKYQHTVDQDLLKKAEQNVSEYMNGHFSFVVLRVDSQPDRLSIEQGMLSTIAQCSECRASKDWLGGHHPNSALREGGLWNVQGLNGPPLGSDEMKALLNNRVK